MEYAAVRLFAARFWILYSLNIFSFCGCCPEFAVMGSFGFSKSKHIYFCHELLMRTRCVMLMWTVLCLNISCVGWTLSECSLPSNQHVVFVEGNLLCCVFCYECSVLLVLKVSSSLSAWSIQSESAVILSENQRLADAKTQFLFFC